MSVLTAVLLCHDDKSFASLNKEYFACFFGPVFVRYLTFKKMCFHCIYDIVPSQSCFLSFSIFDFSV